MKVIHLLLLAGQLAAGAAFAEPYGDRVARCLAENKVAPDAADFDQQAKRCESILKTDDAIATWQACVARAVALMDDRISPASDIAASVDDRCRPEHDAMVDSFSMAQGAKALAISERRKTTHDLGLRLVLMQRAEAKKQQQTSDAMSRNTNLPASCPPCEQKKPLAPKGGVGGR